MKKIILSAVVISFALLSCKKDKSCDLNGSSIQGSYKIVGDKYKANATAVEVDQYALYDACEKDDVVTLNGDNTYTYDDAGVACVPNGDDSGIWALTGSNLSIDGNTATVVYFDCNSFAITYAGAAAGELTTISFARQ